MIFSLKCRTREVREEVRRQRALSEMLELKERSREVREEERWEIPASVMALLKRRERIRRYERDRTPISEILPPSSR